MLFVSLSSVYRRCCSSGVKSEIKEDLVCKFNADVSNFMNELDIKVKDIVANPDDYGVSYVFEGEVNIANVTPYIIDREYISNSFSVDAKAKVVDNARKLNEKKLQDGIKSLNKVKELENFFEDPKIKCFLLMKKKTYFLRNGDSLILPAFCLMRISQENLEKDVEKFFFYELIYNGIVDTVYEIDKSSIKKKYPYSEFLPSSPVNLLKYGGFIGSKVTEANGYRPVMNQHNSVGFNTEWSNNTKPKLENIISNIPENYAEEYDENYDIPRFDHNFSVNQLTNTNQYCRSNNNNYNNNNNFNYVNNDVNNNINNNANSLEGETEDPDAIKKQIYDDIVPMLIRNDEVMKEFIPANKAEDVWLPGVDNCIKYLYSKNNVRFDKKRGDSGKEDYNRFTNLYYNLLEFGRDLYFAKDNEQKNHFYDVILNEEEGYNSLFFENFISDIVLLIGLIQYKYSNDFTLVNSFIKYFFSKYESYLWFLAERTFAKQVHAIFDSRDELINLS